MKSYLARLLAILTLVLVCTGGCVPLPVAPLPVATGGMPQAGVEPAAPLEVR